MSFELDIAYDTISDLKYNIRNLSTENKALKIEIERLKQEVDLKDGQIFDLEASIEYRS